MLKKPKEIQFLKSAFTEENLFNSTNEVLRWLKKRNNAVKVDIKKINFSEMNQWYLDPMTSNLKHKSGAFFTIEGLKVKTNWGYVPEWTQPIINQPEIGFLGIIAKEFNGILYFLMQAKIEPGNINHVQIAPTLQATRSNYQRIHKGKTPLYFEYFKNMNKHKVLIDQLQSEQGARFYKKRNRNIIIEIKEDIPVYDDFCWLTLGQIKKLSQINNYVNMDTRSVVSGIQFGAYRSDVIDFFNFVNSLNSNTNDFTKEMLKSSIDNENFLNNFSDIISWFTNIKVKYELEVNLIPLKDIQNWIITDHDIHHKENKYFKVIATNIEIDNREVKKWDQPLVESAQEGICAFIVKKINDIYHFLVQAKVESGNFDIIEFAPTVQCLPENYRDTKRDILPFLDFVLEVKKEQIYTDTMQSEEGGRFFHEQNRNLIIIADEDFPIEVPENYFWMTLNQLNEFLKFNNYLNIQARSLISLIYFI